MAINPGWITNKSALGSGRIEGFQVWIMFRGKRYGGLESLEGKSNKNHVEWRGLLVAIIDRKD